MAEMSFAEHNDMVETIPSDRTDNPLRVSVLPWRPWRDRPIPYADCAKPLDDNISIDAIPIANDISWRLLPTVSPRSVDGHVLRDAGLSDLEAKLEQLAMDARRSPQRIFRAHPPDQRAQICVDLRSTSKGAGFPTPVPAEAGAVPANEGLGPDDRDGLQHRWKPR
jgi:hypothetical protein